WLHAGLVVHRDLVDPDAAHSRRVAASLPEIPAAVRRAVLGRGLPARHVHRLYGAAVARHRCAIPHPDPALFRLCRSALLAAGIRRTTSGAEAAKECRDTAAGVSPP